MVLPSGSKKTRGPASKVVDELARSFTIAAERVGTFVDRFTIAGASVELRSASPALHSQLARALGHLDRPPAQDATEPDLVVFLWDGPSANEMAAQNFGVADDAAPGALYYLHEPPIRAAYMPGMESISLLDAEAGTAWYCVADAESQPYWEKAAPIRQILFWWLESRGYLQIHGAAVGTPKGGVLIVGKGGSGKSTIALSSLNSELLYAGDDYVAVALKPTPRVQSLYNTGKLEAPHLRERLPHLLPRLSNLEQLESEKAVIYVHEHFPDRTTSGFPLRAVIVPTVIPGRKEHAIRESSRAAAFTALAPSTILQLHTAGPEAFAAMSRLIHRVPCYGLELGRDIAAIPETIRHFLEQLGDD